jgi:protein-S-isoprenylcysteine O-methyltransferase Ste14
VGQAIVEYFNWRYRLVHGPWWAVFLVYETLLLGAWLLEYLLLRRIRSVSGDPIEGACTDRRYLPWWIFQFLLLQFPLWRAGRWTSPIPMTWTITYIATAVALFGMVLRLHAIYYLRENFTYVVHVKPQHHLVTSGLYRYVRHPAYLGLLIYFTGVAFVLSDLYIWLIVMAYVGYSVWRRIRREERELHARFGAEFEAYRRRTHLLIPYVL